MEGVVQFLVDFIVVVIRVCVGAEADEAEAHERWDESIITRVPGQIHLDVMAVAVDPACVERLLDSVEDPLPQRYLRLHPGLKCNETNPNRTRPLARSNWIHTWQSLPRFFFFLFSLRTVIEFKGTSPWAFQRARNKMRYCACSFFSLSLFLSYILRFPEHYLPSVELTIRDMRKQNVWNKAQIPIDPDRHSQWWLLENDLKNPFRERGRILFFLFLFGQWPLRLECQRGA